MYKEKNRKRERCLECGETIHYGRTDKKFCNDRCKNRWHNRENGNYLKIHSKTVRILDKNYKILQHCLETGRTSAEIGDLIQWGFNPEYVTGIRRGRLRMENRCFDIKYYRSETKIFNLEKVDLTPTRDNDH